MERFKDSVWPDGACMDSVYGLYGQYSRLINPHRSAVCDGRYGSVEDRHPHLIASSGKSLEELPKCLETESVHVQVWDSMHERY